MSNANDILRLRATMSDMENENVALRKIIEELQSQLRTAQRELKRLQKPKRKRRKR